MRFPHQVLIRASVDGQDERGNKIRKPGSAVTSPAWMQPISSTEDVADGQQRTSLWRCFLPAGTVCDAWSTVTWEGATYEATGDPADWRTPVGKHHLTLPLRRIGGA